jgi:glycosyltransferase involved in cell wall biosynthesis
VTELSVVVPVYNCADCLRHLHKRLVAALGDLGATYELIFVDDRSDDESWGVLCELAALDQTVRIVRLSRNFGQHAAITAGLGRSNGRWTVVMDCDLEDPPELIPRLYARAQEGYDLVLTERSSRRQSWFRRTAARAYFRSRNAFLKMDMSSEYATLSVLSRKVVDSFLRLRERDRQYMLILHWLGFRRATIPFEPERRYAGKSAYSLRKLIRVGLDGYFFQTTILLRWIVYLGFALATLGLALAAAYVAIYIVYSPPPGWTSVVVIQLIIGGFIIVSTGVTGLYIGKIFSQVKERPLYVVDEDVGGDGPAAAAPSELEAEDVRTPGAR